MRYNRSINLDEKTWTLLDSKRQDVPRSRFIEKLVIQSLEVEN